MSTALACHGELPMQRAMKEAAPAVTRHRRRGNSLGHIFSKFVTLAICFAPFLTAHGPQVLLLDYLAFLLVEIPEQVDPALWQRFTPRRTSRVVEGLMQLIECHFLIRRHKLWSRILCNF